MKKIRLFLLLSLLLPHLLFAEGFVACTENADRVYSEEESHLKENYEKEITTLENVKELAIKDAFHLFTIKTSFAKMKALRADYKMKIAESETLFKENLARLSEKHDEAISLCSLKKKEMFTGEGQ